MAGRFLNEDDCDPVEKIELFQEYDLDRTMLVPSYSALLTRPDALTLDECYRLGMDTTRRRIRRAGEGDGGRCRRPVIVAGYYCGSVRSRRVCCTGETAVWYLSLHSTQYC